MGAWLNLCLHGQKFGMVILDTRIDSNMTKTYNLITKNNTYILIDVLHGANIEIFKFVLAVLLQ